MTSKHNTKKTAFRPFPLAAPTQDAATLQRRAYHLAGHALMTSVLLEDDYYFLLYGTNSGRDFRVGEIDGVEMHEGNLSWHSRPQGGWTSMPEWTEVIGIPDGKLAPPHECAVLAAGCAAEIVLNPSYEEIAMKQATGDRARFHRVISSPQPHLWEKTVYELAATFEEDRPALDKVAEAVEKSLQRVHVWTPHRLGIPESFGPAPGSQFREAALFSQQTEALASTARLASFESDVAFAQNGAAFEA